LREGRLKWEAGPDQREGFRPNPKWSTATPPDKDTSKKVITQERAGGKFVPAPIVWKGRNLKTNLDLRVSSISVGGGIRQPRPCK